VLSPEILRILEAVEVSTLDLPLAQTMPSDVYTSEAFYRFEQDAIFAREWLCLGHQSQVPRPGDYMTITVGDEPLVVVRTDQGGINVLSGICQHRGYPITANQPVGNVKQFRCPYHWWAYSFEGSLVAAPEMARTYDLDALKLETALPSLSVEMWNGLIFATMAKDPEPLAPTITKLGADLAGYGMTEMVAMPAIDYPDLPWNWKGMHENALEPYHTQFVHRGYHEMAPARNATFVEWDDDDGQIMHPTYFIHPDGGFNPTEKALFPIIPGLSEQQRSRIMFASIPPTAFLAMMPDQVFLFMILPQSAETMTLRIVWLFPQSSLDAPGFQEMYESQTGANDVLNQQDMVTNGFMQIGQRSRFAPRGRYSHQEATLPQLNRWLAKRYRSYADEVGTDQVRPAVTERRAIGAAVVGPTQEVFPPVIDLSAADAHTQIDRACRAVGFFQVVEHGIGSDTIGSALAEVDTFFSRPLADKMRWTSPAPEIERGYSAKGSEGLSYSLGLDRPPDLFEAFTMGREEYPPGDPGFRDDRHHFFAPNIWPDDAPGLRRALAAYFVEVQGLAHRLTTLFAQALGLERDFFESRTGHSLDALRVNYFEGLPDLEVLDDQFGIGPHTDYGILTVLLADGPGLEVVTPDGEWRAVDTVPGALVVNVSDMLAQWTNDHWRSTLHRVQAVRPRAGLPGRRRSLPFFHEGDYDMVVECLPTCCSLDDPPRYQPVLAGEHVAAKVLSGHIQEAAAAGSTLGDRVGAVG
jgi:isopenicillin N synthase-like dioxygenase/phenylpropionate dioxygenase-like ring-hydroxylating dioxygenase large terminal subunit